MNFWNRVNLFLSLVLISSTLYSATYEEGSLRSFDVQLEELIPEEEAMHSSENGVSPVPVHEYDLILQEIIERKKFTSELDVASFYALPIAVMPKGQTDPSYALVIHKAEIHPEYAVFDAFMVITNPFDNTKVRFKADNVKFSFESGLVGDVALTLMDTKTTKIINDISLTWLPGTYVSWDCNGFKSIGLNATIELSQKRFKAISLPSFKEEGKVYANFFAEFSDFKNFVVDINLPAFKVVGMDELVFHFQHVVLDFSDFHNADSMVFPTNYPDTYSGDMENLWRGLFVSKAEIYLSPKFNDNQNKPVSFYAEGILLDDNGLTGLIGARNILTKERGVLGAWPFSIDDINIELLAGRLQSLTLAGETQLPGTSTGVFYDAYLDAEEVYHFGLTLTKAVKFDVFAAEATLHPSSRIDVYVENGEFAPTALLNGEFTFKVSNKPSDSKADATLSLPSLSFEGLRISTVPPVLDISYIGYASDRGDNELAKFPVTIESFAFRKSGSESVVFDFGFHINLSPGGGGSIGGGATVGIHSDISGQDWKFKKLEVSGISVNASKPGAFSFTGSLLLFEDDPIYGKGFKGEVDASFAETFSLKATALFGKVDSYRYFSVDAYLYTTPGIPAGPFILTGFGGGLSYRMRQQVPGSGDMGSTIGETSSGLIYIPDNKVSLGLTAGVKAGIVNENIVNAEINFGIIFLDTGGIKQISFTGEAALISTGGVVSEEMVKQVSNAAAQGKSQPAQTSEPMRARVSILMDFEERIFHTEMEVYLNIAGAIKGIGQNNRAGWGVLHIEPSKWYLHIGTPSDPVGVSLIGLFESRSYFMAGHDIPDAMMMDQRVLQILGKTNADFDGDRDPNQLIEGNGIAFGAKVSFDTGDLRFLIFYAAFEMGFGFDVMLLQYGDDVYCEGYDGLGINNWYAKGQIYAYVAGKIGIRARVFRRTRTFDIINLQVAAALRMEGPNPFWLYGVVGGKYRILGGLIKGKCNFEVTVGNKCDMKVRTQELADMEIIGDLTPANNSEEIDPFVYPQAVFNMPVGKSLKISEDEKLTKEFKVNLVEYSLFHGETRMNGLVEWNREKTTLAFVPDEVLLPTTDYRIFVKVGFDEKVGDSWSPYKNDSGEIHYETREVTFTTGNLPIEIPDREIAYSYPLKRMMNLYTEEYSKAYIAFNRWMPGYFTPMDGWEQKVRWVPANGGPAVYSNLVLKQGVKTVETDIPVSLTKGATYYMQLVNVPIDENQSVDRNIVEHTTQVKEKDGTDTGTEIATRTADGIIGDSEDLVFYSLGFRVSKYATLAEKIGADELKVSYLYNVGPAIKFLGVTIYPNEPFDGYEIEHNANRTPLIRFTAVLENADWYKANMYPVLYQGYPFHARAQVERNVALYGLPPVRPVRIDQGNEDYILSEEDVEQQRIGSKAMFSDFVYELPKVWAADYAFIRNEISYHIDPTQWTDKMLYLMNHFPWPQVSAGNYPVNIEYVLPGINKVASSNVVILKNPFDTPQVNLISNEE